MTSAGAGTWSACTSAAVASLDLPRRRRPEQCREPACHPASDDSRDERPAEGYERLARARDEGTVRRERPKPCGHDREEHERVRDRRPDGPPPWVHGDHGCDRDEADELRDARRGARRGAVLCRDDVGHRDRRRRILRDLLLDDGHGLEDVEAEPRDPHAQEAQSDGGDQDEGGRPAASGQTRRRDEGDGQDERGEHRVYAGVLFHFYAMLAPLVLPIAFVATAMGRTSGASI